MRDSRKYPYFCNGRLLGIPRERRGGGGGLQNKKTCGGSMDIFWNNTAGNFCTAKIGYNRRASYHLPCLYII